jgi:hypothetical protein
MVCFWVNRIQSACVSFVGWVCSDSQTIQGCVAAVRITELHKLYELLSQKDRVGHEDAGFYLNRYLSIIGTWLCDSLNAHVHFKLKDDVHMCAHD